MAGMSTAVARKSAAPVAKKSSPEALVMFDTTDVSAVADVLLGGPQLTELSVQASKGLTDTDAELITAASVELFRRGQVSRLGMAVGAELLIRSGRFSKVGDVAQVIGCSPSELSKFRNAARVILGFRELPGTVQPAQLMRAVTTSKGSELGKLGEAVAAKAKPSGKDLAALAKLVRDGVADQTAASKASNNGGAGKGRDARPASEHDPRGDEGKIPTPASGDGSVPEFDGRMIGSLTALAAWIDVPANLDTLGTQQVAKIRTACAGIVATIDRAVASK